MDDYCVRHGESKDFDQLRKLWELCFPEAPEFNAFFFEKMYSPHAVRLISVSGEIVAALYVFLYSFVKKNECKLKGYYIYGVGTHPKMRGRGFAGILLNETLKEAREHGMDLCMLVPQNESLFAFYERFGFTPAFGMREEGYSVNAKIEGDIRKAKVEDIPKINSIYEKAFSGKLHVEREYKEWELLIEEFSLSGGAIYVLEERGEAVAYGTYAEEAGTYAVREFAAVEDKYADAILGSIAQAEKKSGISVFIPDGKTWYGSVCQISESARNFDFQNAYMNLMHS